MEHISALLHFAFASSVTDTTDEASDSDGNINLSISTRLHDAAVPIAERTNDSAVRLNDDVFSTADEDTAHSETEQQPQSQPQSAVKKRRRKKSGISQKANGNKQKKTNNPAKRHNSTTISIISPLKTQSKVKSPTQKSLSTIMSKQAALIQTLEAKVLLLESSITNLNKENKAAHKETKEIIESCDKKIAAADKEVKKYRDRISSKQDDFKQASEKKEYATKEKINRKDIKQLEASEKHQALLEAVEVKHEIEIVRVRSEHMVSVKALEQIFQIERDKHTADMTAQVSEMKVLRVGIEKEREKHSDAMASLERGIDVTQGHNMKGMEAFEKDHEMEKKKMEGVHARRIGKLKKREKELDKKLKRSTSQKEVAKQEASTSKVAMDTAEKTASAESKKHTKLKKKAESDIQHATAAKRQKVSELSAVASQLSIVHQQLIDTQEEKDDALKELSQLRESRKDPKEWLAIFEKVRTSRKGGSKKYSLTILQLILECIVSGAPPSSIQAILVIFAQTFDDSIEIKEMPSLTYIRRCRSILLTVTKTIASLRLSKAKQWSQMFSDATSIQLVPFQDIIISLREGDVFKPVVLSAAAVLENGETADAVRDTVLTTIQESGDLLAGLTAVIEREHPEYIHDIPKSHEMTVGKLYDGFMTTDTCACATSFNYSMQDSVIEAAKVMMQRDAETDGVEAKDIKVYMVMCWHHLRNIWFKAVVTRLSKYLNEALEEHLSRFDPEDRIGTGMDNMVRLCEKYFGLQGNYAKGDGDRFQDYMEKNHSGVTLLPLLRACSGARFDICIEGAAAIFWNRQFWIPFLKTQFQHKEKEVNKMVRSLYTMLASKQMVALTRLCTILNLAIVLPHRFFAGKCDTLSEDDNDWCVSSMNLVADAIDNALTKLIADPSKVLDKAFMMSIFDGFKHIQSFKEWSDYTYVSGRKTKTVGNKKKKDRVFAMTALLKLAFDPEDLAIKETDSEVINLTVVASVAMKTDMHDPKKNTAKRLTEGKGDLSWGKISAEEKKAGRGIKAVNDEAESIFAIVKSEKLKGGTSMSIAHAGAVSQSKKNHDFRRVFGSEDATALGYFHSLDKEMQDAVLIFAEEKLKQVGLDHRNAIQAHREHTTRRHEKERQAHQVTLQNKYERTLKLHKMLGTSAAWMSAEDVDNALTKLGSETKMKDAVKDQFRMWTIGAGWKDVHQAFSKKGIGTYDSAYLANQLKVNVIHKHVEAGRRWMACPSEPFSTKKPLPEMGDTMSDVLALNEEEKMRERRVMSAMYEKCGLTDQPLEMPQLEDLVGKKIEYVFWHQDETDSNDKGYGMWHIGTIIKTCGEDVTIEWDIDYDDPDAQITEEELTDERWVRPGNILEEKSWRLG